MCTKVVFYFKFYIIEGDTGYFQCINPYARSLSNRLPIHSPTLQHADRYQKAIKRINISIFIYNVCSNYTRPK